MNNFPAQFDKTGDLRMVSVIGASLTEFGRRKDGSSFRDWAADAFESALSMSGLERSDIDLLACSSESDFFTFQLNPASVIAGDLGLTGAASMRVEGGGASGQLAVHSAVNAIRSGQAKRAAVVGFDPSASQLSAAAVKELYCLSFDAWTDGMTGTSSTVLYALSFQFFMETRGLDERHLAQVTIQNRDNALSNAKAHLGRRHSAQEIYASPIIASPYRRLHCSPLSDGAAAIILSERNSAPNQRRNAPRIVGIGASSDKPRLGARNAPGEFRSKTAAMKIACASAGLTPADIGLAEIYDAYAGAQLQAIEALGFTDDIICDLERDAFRPGGRLPVNLSGGLMGQGAPAGAIGVGQTANCALFLEGLHYSELQPASPPKYALADTHGGVCTTSAVTILGVGL
ncbi:MAG: thiolase family protein [Albidovulum sp.]|nr:thiolase family protein [Albidovulum sp.]